MTDERDDVVEAVRQAIQDVTDEDGFQLWQPSNGNTDRHASDLIARAAIAAYREALEAAGYVEVPAWPTETMQHHADSYFQAKREAGDRPPVLLTIYRAMVAARPK